MSATSAAAHAGLTIANPAGGSTLGASPTAVELTFTEPVDPALSTITVTGRRGNTYQDGTPERVAGDPLSLSVAVRSLPKGVYTVRWRVDSEVDGHATRGVFSFGVQVPAPSVGVIGSTGTTTPISSPLELVARWVLLLGLVALLGAAVADLVGFGDGGRRDAYLATCGWAVTALGLVLLAVAQRHNAGVSLGALLRSPVGHALIWRAVAIAAAGAALLVAILVPRVRQAALGVVAVATVAAIVVHVANGHAAASAWPAPITVAAQAAHFAAAGVWIGGLAALLLGLRASASPDSARRVSRFAVVAAIGLAVVVATGVLRAVSELRVFDQLWSTGYGRAVVAKVALVALIAALGFRNRRAAPRSGGSLAPLRRRSIAELSLAAGALAVAALLGTLAPPVAGHPSGLIGLSASGADVGNNVRVHLSALSNQPGSNHFVAQVTDSHSGAPLRDAAVELVFAPLDDPGVASSSLALVRARDGSYVGTGGNLRFDGRWAVRVLVRALGSSVEVPLELDPIGPPQSISIERIPGQAPKYTKLDGNIGFVRISPHPERAGTSMVYVTCYTVAIGAEMPIRSMVVTLAAGDGPTTQQPLRRIGPGSFVSTMRLSAGHNQIAVIAHTGTRTRLRSVFDLQVPGP